MQEQVYEALRAVVGQDGLVENAPMAEYTSFRTGGRVDLLVVPQSREALAGTLWALADLAVEPYIMGNGSNILVRDGGYRGVVVKIGSALSGIKVEGGCIIAETGALLKQVAQAALEHGLQGLEFAAGIPGSLGGALYMNAGAYGGEMKDVVAAVECLDRSGQTARRRSGAEMAFGYRRSALMEAPEIAFSAELCLKPGKPAEIRERMEALAQERRTKQPLQYPSAGSFFKRPPGHFAGKLIQEAGLMGYRVGGACVSTLHAGFILNDRQATATDILDLMDEVQRQVYETSGVRLEPEVRIIGDPATGSVATGEG